MFKTSTLPVSGRVPVNSFPWNTSRHQVLQLKHLNMSQVFYCSISKTKVYLALKHCLPQGYVPWNNQLDQEGRLRKKYRVGKLASARRRRPSFSKACILEVHNWTPVILQHSACPRATTVQHKSLTAIVSHSLWGKSWEENRTKQILIKNGEGRPHFNLLLPLCSMAEKASAW